MSTNQSTKLHFAPNVFIPHSITEWIDVNGTHVRCQFLFLDHMKNFEKEPDQPTKNSEISALKYIPLHDAAKNLIYVSLVDLVTNNRKDRVQESFNFMFQDNTVYIFCELLSYENLTPKPINLKILKNVLVKVYVADVEDMVDQERAIMRLVDLDRQTKISNFLVKSGRKK